MGDSRRITLEELIEELARVIWEPDRARAVVLSAGFPRQDLPDFKTPRVFWTLVMGGLHDGPGAGSVQSLSDKAALEFPDNEVFVGCREAPPSSRGAARDAGRLRREIIDFSAERGRHKHFFGREDVLGEMDAWVSERDGGWLVITGSPGLGKSALMDRWLRRREAAGSLTAFHFIRRGHLDWAEPQVMQRNLAAQIEVMFPEQRDPDVDPVYRLEQLLGRVGPVLAERDARLVLLVDGLDEAMTLGKDNPIPYIFPLEVPEGVFVVTASRPRYPHLNWFHRRTGATTWIDLDERVESNEQAVREHWQRLGATMEPPLREELVHAAIGGASGNLLHAVKLFELWSRPKAERSPGDVPQGFEGMLEELWERTGALPKDAKERVRDGLSLISAARESLPLRVVDELLGWDEGDAEDELLPLAREMLLEEPWHEEPAYRPFHEGLRELIERKRPRSIREHHGVLSAYSAWPIEGDAFRRSYALRHCVEHRVESGQVDAAAKACIDVAYLTAKACAEGVAAVERDIRLATEARKDDETRRRLTTLGRLVAASAHWASDVPEALPALLHDRTLTNAPVLLKDLVGIRHLTSACPRLRHPLQIRGVPRILQGHQEPVMAVALLPGGRIVSGALDDMLRVWDMESGRPLAVFHGHEEGVAALAVAPDGRLVSGSYDGTVRVWDVETGQNLVTLRGHQSGVNSVAVSPNGRIISGSNDETVRVWDVETRTAIATLRHQDRVNVVRVLPDGRIASGSDDKTVRVWNVKTRRILSTLRGHQSSVETIAVLPDGRIVSGSLDHTLRIWDVQTGQTLAILHGHHASVTTSAVLSDGNRVVSGAEDYTLRIWDIRTGRVLSTLRGHQNTVLATLALPDGRIVSGSEDGTVRVWDMQAEHTLALHGHEHGVEAVAVCPNGRVVSGSVDGTLRVWDTQTGQSLATLHGSGFGANGVLAALPDSCIVSGSYEGLVRVWDVEAGRVLATHEGPDRLESVAVFADGRVVFGTGHCTAHVWDVKAERPLAVLQGHPNVVSTVAVLPDGRVVSGSYDNTVRVWDVETERALATLEGHQDRVMAVVALPDGRVVSGSDDKTLRVWDIETGRALATLPGHQRRVWTLAVLPDGRVVSGSDDNTLRVWDVETGRTLATIYGDAAFHSVACVDQHLIVAGDNLGNVWFIDLPDLP